VLGAPPGLDRSHDGHSEYTGTRTSHPPLSTPGPGPAWPTLSSRGPSPTPASGAQAFAWFYSYFWKLANDKLNAALKYHGKILNKCKRP